MDDRSSFSHFIEQNYFTVLCNTTVSFSEKFSFEFFSSLETFQLRNIGVEIFWVFFTECTESLKSFRTRVKFYPKTIFI